MPDLVFCVSTKSDHHLVCHSVMSFEPVLVNVSCAPTHVCVNIVKSVSCNSHVCSIAKPKFCNAVKSVYLTHHFRKVTHDVIISHRKAFYTKTNVLSSSRTKSSPSYCTSNPRFSLIVISSRDLQHISL